MAVMALGLLAGCQGVGFFLDSVPKRSIPATYKPQNRPTVVLVDDPGHTLPHLALKGLIAERIGRDLRERNVIGEFVPPKEMDELALNDPEFGGWPVDRVGAEVGAEQVIFILIEDFRLRDETGGFYRPSAVVRVRVVDVEAGQRLFPTEERSGYTLASHLFYRDTADASQAMEHLLARRLADRIGADTARLFYRHRPREVGSGFDD